MGGQLGPGLEVARGPRGQNGAKRESAEQLRLSWPGADGLTVGCSASGRTEVSVHPVTVKWPEEMGAALQEETLTYKAI